MQIILIKLAELIHTREHLQKLGMYDPTTIDTDRLIEENIKRLEYILEKRYDIKIYKEVKS